jgi:hypothetical protein
VPVSRSTAQLRASIGGTVRAALATDRDALTRAARDARWQKYVDQVLAVLPELTDEAEINRRAELLRTADMKRLALKSAKARREARQAARELAELDQAQPA